MEGALCGASSGGGNGASLIDRDDLGRRVSLTRGNGTSTAYRYDPASRLDRLTLDLAGPANDVQVSLGYNPAGQIVSRLADNDLYAWTGHYDQTLGYTNNGLNQAVQVGAGSLSYDGKGNLASNGSNGFSYTAENRLSSVAGLTGFGYDPLGRLFFSAGGGIAFRYDGDHVSTELDLGASRWRSLRLYVWGPDAMSRVQNGCNKAGRRN